MRKICPLKNDACKEDCAWFLENTCAVVRIAKLLGEIDRRGLRVDFF